MAAPTRLAHTLARSLTTSTGRADISRGARGAHEATTMHTTSHWRDLANPFAPPPLNMHTAYHDLFTPLPTGSTSDSADSTGSTSDKNIEPELTIPASSRTPRTPLSYTDAMLNRWRSRMASPSAEAPLTYVPPGHRAYGETDIAHGEGLPTSWVHTDWGIRGYPHTHSHASVNLVLVNAERPDSNELEACILFTKRPNTMNSYAGHVCFPGGKLDPAEDTVNIDAARRELHEELNFGNGLSLATSTFGASSEVKSGIEVEYLGELPSIPDRFRRSEIHTFVAYANQRRVTDDSWTIKVGDNPHLIHSHEEVTRVFCVPLSDLLDPRNYVFTAFRMQPPRKPGQRPPPTQVGPVWTVQGEQIWGLTAMSLWWFLVRVVGDGKTGSAAVVRLDGEGRPVCENPARTAHLGLDKPSL